MEAYDDREPMRGGYALSGMLHLGIIALIVLGLPDFLKPKPLEVQPIAVNVISPSDLTRALQRNAHPMDTKNDKPPTDTPNQQQKPVEHPDLLQPTAPPQTGTTHPGEDADDNAPPPVVQPPTPKPPPPKPDTPKPPPPKPAPPKEVPKPPPPPPVEAPAPKPPPPPPPPKKVEPPKEQPKPAPPKEEPKPTPPKQEQQPPPKKVDAAKPPAKPKKPKADTDFDSMMKNLTKDATALEKTDAPPRKSKSPPAPQAASIQPDAPLGSQLSTSQIDTVRAQVVKCWNPPVGGKDEHSIVVVLQLSIGPDAVVNDVQVVSNNTQSSLGYAVQSSVVRALKSPDCNPLKLPMDKYDTWKDLRFRFNPP